MARSLRKAITVCSVFRKSYSSILAVASNAIRLTYNSTYVPLYLGMESSISYENYKPGGVMFSRQFSSRRESETLSWGVSSDVVLLGKLESALRNHNLEEAWETYKDFKRLYGFPDPFLVDKLLTKLSYSSDSRWLKKACNIVGSILKEKREMLRTELMTKLCLSLARTQMPIQASSILRLMLEKGNLPPIDMLGMIIFHMVKSDTGMIVSSNILIEIYGSSHQLTTKKSTELNKHNTLLFNLVLDACARFGSSSKGHQIIELMAQVGVTADAHTISIISLIHEMNGMRDELKKFKKHIDQVSVPLFSCYQQFYESLLCLHFKFNDIDAASNLVQDIYGFQVSHHQQGNETQPPKPCLVSIGSDNLRTGLKLRIFPHSLSRDSVFNVGRNQVLVMYKNGKLALSNRALAKLIIQYKRCGRINDLSKLLCSIQKKGSVESSRMCSDVVSACICMGWLEIAHDILDDLDSEGNPLDASSYMSLLTAYCNRNKLREAEALLKQLKRSGVILASDPLLAPASMCELESKNKLKELDTSAKGELAYHIVEEMRAEENEASFMMHDLNFSIYFFMKAHMVEDAVRAYRKMQAMKIHPTVSTFMNLLNGYSSLGMYREITILWGDIKRNMESRKNLNTRDLYEFLLLNFLRGGYFHRVMEVIGLMKENGMYLDKWMYRREFLKYHKGLYLRIKVSSNWPEPAMKNMKSEWLTLLLVNLGGIMERADESLLPGVYKEVGKALHTDPTGLGSLTLIRSIVQCLCYPLAAYLSGRQNRTHVIALGAFLWSAATFLVALSSTFTQVAISRGLNGIGLAIVGPAIQSLVADSTDESNRGIAFGWLQLTGNFGSILGGLISVLLAQTSFMGIAGWRISFHLVGFISVVVGILVRLFAKDPRFIDNVKEQPPQKPFREEVRELLKEARAVVKVPSFQILVAQGVSGSFPWSSLSFTPMWLELIGFSHKTTALLLTLFNVALSMGGLFGGKMGDVLAKHFPNSGRIILSQISSGSAIPFAAILLLGLPDDPSTAAIHGLVLFIMGLTISWNGPATNNPIFAEIVPERARTSIYALDRSFESILASFAPPVVGILAQHVYGFKPIPKDLTGSQEIETDRENAASLAKALYTAIGIPITICCFIYSFLYCTYPRDRDRAKMDALIDTELQRIDKTDYHPSDEENEMHKKELTMIDIDYNVDERLDNDEKRLLPDQL